MALISPAPPESLCLYLSSPPSTTPAHPTADEEDRKCVRMDAHELGRWTRFAAKGGIGKCVAVQDCIAEEDEDLMFLKDDEIVVLMQLPKEEDLYLGYCEGVVGRFRGSNVRFSSRLKRPVMAKRSSRSLSRSSSRPPSAQGRRDSLSALAHRDSPSLPQPSTSAAEVSVSVSHNLDAAPPSSSPHPPQDHLRSVSHSSGSTAIESTPHTPADFPSEPTHDMAAVVTIVDSPTPQEELCQEPKLPEPDEDHAPLYADDPADEAPSYLASDSPRRISVASSAGAPAIGLSLLQDFVNGNVDDAASLRSVSESVSTVEEQVPSPALSDPPSHAHTSPRSSVYSLGSAHREAPSRTSTHTHPSSNVSSDYGGEEWDGASDIYDNYRYSRASMASKMSRFSKGSMHSTAASGLGLDAPPLPITDSHRPSLDSVRGPIGGGARGRLGSTSSSSIEDARMSHSPGTSHPDPVEHGPPGRRIPPPLDLASSNHSRNESLTTPGHPSSSPLLHSAFRSPLSSPGAPSPTYLSPTSTTTPSTAPLFSSTPGGAASALRQRLEMGKGAAPSSLDGSSLALPEGDARGKARLSTQPIVVEDDEGMPDTSTETGHRPSPSPSSPSFSAIEEKKRMLETTYVVVNQAPPPPYTPMSPTEPSSSEPSQAPTIPRRPREQNGAEGSAGASNAFARQSMFMPHPHAPKPAAVPSGPMYGRSPVHMEQQHSMGPPPGSVTHTLHMALAARGDPYRPRVVTIYGKFERELASSVGPVPISFSLEPQNNVPANRPGPSPSPVPPVAVAVAGGGGGGGSESGQGEVEASGSKPIPRPNFFPQAPSIRPRSRSFSEFDTPESSKTSEPQPQPNNSTVGRSKSVVAPSAAARQPPQHRPSPLSIPTNNVVAAMDSARTAQSSPLAQPPPLTPSQQRRSPLSPLPPSDLQPQISTDRQPSAVASPSTTPSSLPEEGQSVKSPVTRNVSLVSSPTSPTSPLKSFHALRHSRSSTLSNRHSADRDRPSSRSSELGRKSGESDLHGAARNNNASPSTAPTLRSKLSLPALKIKSSDRFASIDEKSPTLSVTPSESLSLALSEQPTVHVKDVDFEMVTGASVQQLVVANAADEDPSSSPLPSPSRLDAGGSVRSSSPAVSTLSGRVGGGGPASGITVPQQVSSPPLPGNPTDAGEIEAHRQRELRWITAMASTSPSAARKSKKVRKLLYEGVPASVRYLVWAHLADSKAKRTDGVYTKLMMRERVSVMGAIERDVRRVFSDEGPLLDGSLVNVLQAYFVMVPDTQYCRGLTVIAGRLLLQAPEEDAFWTFVSMMDSHLRPYFSPSSSMVDVDAGLFGKAVEAVDAALAKRLFGDMDIPSISLVRPWFTALFLEALPFEHSQRVWDIFLFEGVTFLFRVGLAVVQCCKAFIQQTSDRDTILHTLLHPPASMLPSSPDAFLEMASTVKLKDDDVRKQRIKLEAQQSKRLAQARGNSGKVGNASSKPLRPSISSISLPRNNSRADLRQESLP